jgi:tetratricopeptide (TPR) repeat protein
MLIRCLFLMLACWQSTFLLAQSNNLSVCDVPSKNCLTWVNGELGNVKPYSMQWYNYKLLQLDSLISIKQFNELKRELSSLKVNRKLPPMFSVHMRIYQAKLDLIDGNKSHAKKLLKLSLKDLQQLNQSFYSPLRMIQIANLMQDLEQYAQSLTLLEKIKTDFENSRDIYLKLDLYGNLGHVHRHLKNYDAALANYKLSLEFAIELGNEQQISTLYAHVARMYQATNQLELAELNFVKALAHAEKDAQSSTVMNSKINLALFYVQQLELDKAQVLTNEIDGEKIEIHQKDKWKVINDTLKTGQ